MVGVKVYDNGGKTVDRYTILIDNGKDIDFYTMSDDPFSPLGVNQYSHSWPNTMAWRRPPISGKN